VGGIGREREGELTAVQQRQGGKEESVRSPISLPFTLGSLALGDVGYRQGRSDVDSSDLDLIVCVVVQTTQLSTEDSGRMVATGVTP